MGDQHRDPHAAAVVARDELRSGVVVSTVRLPGPEARYESMAFSPGWPATGDALASAQHRNLADALVEHRALVERFEAPGEPDPTDPNWVFRMMGLPPRRYPRGRP